MKSLKEKIQETTKKHEKEISDNLRDRAIHLGNLKNIAPGDKIQTYHSCFYHTPEYAEVYMVDKENDGIYIHLHYTIRRFHMFNCEEWELDCKKPAEEGTTMKENWSRASSNFIDLIKYPIINVKYKSKMPIDENFLCYDIENLTACPHLTWAITGSYRCNHLKEYIYLSGSSWAVILNSKECNIRG